MKKLLSIILTAVMVMALAVPVFAAEDDCETCGGTGYEPHAAALLETVQSACDTIRDNYNSLTNKTSETLMDFAATVAPQASIVQEAIEYYMMTYSSDEVWQGAQMVYSKIEQLPNEIQNIIDEERNLAEVGDRISSVYDTIEFFSSMQSKKRPALSAAVPVKFLPPRRSTT